MKDDLESIFVEILVEMLYKESISKDFDTSTTEHLLYLVHDKSHVMSNKSKMGFLNEVFAAYKNDKSNIKVYRGLYVEKLEDFKVGGTYTFDRYQSFSEDLQIAHDFSKNKLILQLNNHRGGFPYWRWMVDYFEKMKKEDPFEFRSVDGDFMIKAAKEEKEWIYNIGTTVRIVESFNKSAYTHIIAEM